MARWFRSNSTNHASNGASNANNGSSGSGNGSNSNNIGRSNGPSSPRNSNHYHSYGGQPQPQPQGSFPIRSASGGHQQSLPPSPPISGGSSNDSNWQSQSQSQSHSRSQSHSQSQYQPQPQPHSQPYPNASSGLVSSPVERQNSIPDGQFAGPPPQSSEISIVPQTFEAIEARQNRQSWSQSQSQSQSHRPQPWLQLQPQPQPQPHLQHSRSQSHQYVHRPWAASASPTLLINDSSFNAGATNSANNTATRIRSRSVSTPRNAPAQASAPAPSADLFEYSSSSESDFHPRRRFRLKRKDQSRRHSQNKSQNQNLSPTHLRSRNNPFTSDSASSATPSSTIAISAPHPIGSNSNSNPNSGLLLPSVPRHYLNSSLKRAGAAVLAVAVATATATAAAASRHRRSLSNESDSDFDTPSPAVLDATRHTQSRPRNQSQPQPQSRPHDSMRGSKSQKTAADSAHFRSLSGSGPGLSAAGGPSRDDEEEFETGTCMTCTAAMRWPTSANAFRCIGCLAINDVVPRQLQLAELTKSLSPPTASIDGGPVHKIPRKPVNAPLKQISLSLTQTLIDESLETFLMQTLFPSPAHDSFNMHHMDQALGQGHPQAYQRSSANGKAPMARPIEPKKIFQRLEEYIATCFSTDQCINNSFSNLAPNHLLSGPVPPSSVKNGDGPTLTGSRSPHIDWDNMKTWYMSVVNVAGNWQNMYSRLEGAADPAVLAGLDLVELERQLLVAQEHVQKALLKATEQLLKRPGRMLVSPDDVRFLVIIIENPLLGQEPSCFSGVLQPDQPKQHHNRFSSEMNRGGAIRPITGYHSGIIKRILGLVANSAPACQKYLIQWFARYPLERFVAAKDMASRFLAYRLTRHKEKRRQPVADTFSKLVPELPTESPARAQAAIETMIATENSSERRRRQQYQSQQNGQLELAEVPRDDWQIVAAARVLSLLFRANDLRASKRSIHDVRTKSRGQFVPTSDFYISMLDLMDLVDDFNFWDSRGIRFSFCQFPFLISIGAKKQIIEHDAKRQMAEIMRETILAGVLSNSRQAEHMLLDVRRECIVEDSLKGISDVVSRGGRDLWKKLRIVFHGEEGLDYGGLKKEWFLQLVREVFNPDHGMFVYDDDSHYCYFNPYSLENSDQYYLVGVVLGLAIYNSTILDVAFPPFAFRKLLAPAQNDAVLRIGHSRPPMTYTLADLAEYRPQLASGLQALLDYEGNDVEDVFCLNFVISMDRYGTPILVPLCPGGAAKAVTAANRHEYVDLYVRHMLDVSVARQFEPFRRGFWTVCGRSTALSLCRPEEVELLIRGSDETLDIESLQGVAIYENWERTPDIGRGYQGQHPSYRQVRPEEEAVVRWFWQTFKEATAENQRKLLVFITGSDRIPAGGAASLSIKITCLGNDVSRFPIARTCFNTLALHRYRSKEMLEAKLWTAVHESEGFGIK